MTLREAMEVAARLLDATTGGYPGHDYTEAAATLRRWMPFCEAAIKWAWHCEPDAPTLVEGCKTCDEFAAAYRAAVAEEARCSGL